jgi:hypothetical protein
MVVFAVLMAAEASQGRHLVAECVASVALLLRFANKTVDLLRRGNDILNRIERKLPEDKPSHGPKTVMAVTG